MLCVIAWCAGLSLLGRPVSGPGPGVIYLGRMLAARQKAAAHEAKLKAGKGKEVRAEAAAEKKAAADKAAAAKYSAELAKPAQEQKSHQKK